jgi:spermidine synthase
MSQRTVNSKISPSVVYAAALVLAACSLLYELLIAQTLATLAANTVVWYSVTIGVYLAAMGMGALLHDKYATDNLWARLFRVELLLSAVGALAVPILYFIHTFALLLDLNDLTFVGNAVFFASAFILTAVIGVLTGFELPLLIDLGNEASREKRVTNRVLASDYMGSLVGGLAFPLVLMPNLGLIVIGLLTAGINLIMALIALRWLLPKSRHPALRLATSGSLAAAILLGLFFGQPIEKYFVKNYYFYFEHSDDPGRLFGSLENVADVFRARSPYQRIDIVHDKAGYDTDVVIDAYSSKFIENPAQPRNYVLFLNGDFQLASSYEEYYHEFFAHVPIVTNGAAPSRVLVMGAGDGLLIRELIKYPDIESIVHVDLDRKLVELAKSHPVLLAMNEGALDDPRVRTYFDDAYRYIRNTTDSFDAIYLDFPLPNDYNLSKLYSREFFYFVRQRLAPGGFVVLDTPGLKRRGNMYEIYTSTVKTAGFKYVRPYISKIEDYNREAMMILLRSGYGMAKSRRLLVDHAQSLRYGFVIARNNVPEVPFYRDPHVKLHVLTDERLLATLQNTMPLMKAPDLSKVNSIFRPTLPDGRIWDIRNAW